MSNTGQAETPMSDHVARFWRYLQTETVRILLDLKRTVGTDAPDGPVVYWDGSSFGDDVAKALVADRERLTAENERLRAALVAVLEDGTHEELGEFGYWVPSNRAVLAAQAELRRLNQQTTVQKEK